MPGLREDTPIVLAYLERDGRVLLTRRPPGTHLAGYWEFPGGKAASGESLAAALAREVWEETGARVAVGEEVAVTRYHYPDRCVELHLFRCTLASGEPASRQVAAVRWVPVECLAAYPFPPANGPLLVAIRRRFAAEHG